MFKSFGNRSLNDKTFFYILIAVLLMSFVMTIEIIILRYPIINLITWIVSLCVSGISIYYFYNERYVNIIQTCFFGIMTFVVLPYGWLFSSTRSPFTLGYAFLVLISVCYYFEGFKRIVFSICIMIISVTMIILGVIKPHMFPVVGNYKFIINTIILTPVIMATAMFLLITYSNDIKEKNAELQIASYTDYLTGLYNRRYIYDYLENYEKKCSAHENIIVGMIDINKFKMINDVYGHLVGDRVLKALARHIKSICGPESIVGRTGGDEFIVIIKNSQSFSIDNFSEKFEKSIMDFNPKEFKDIPSIAISGGFVVCNKNMTIDEMVAQADSNMYIAKNKPNNGIVFTHCQNQG